MAWSYTTIAICSALSGIAQAVYRDEWSDWVEEMISDYMGVTYIGTTAAIAGEPHDGDGTDTIVVDHPPVVSVSALTISNSSIPTSSYRVYSWGIRLVSSEGTELEASMIIHSVFPVGVQNVQISYVSGAADVPQRVQLAATLMINELAKMSRREGSDASIKYGQVDRSMDEEPEIRQIGIYRKLKTIMKATLHKRMRVG